MFTKKGQAEVITTVLLIFVGIVAIIALSAFVLNFVKDNLSNTGCYDSIGQLEIVEGDYTRYDSVNHLIYVNIKRGSKDFDLTSMNIIIANNLTQRKIKFDSSDQDKVYYVNFSSASSNPWVNDKVAPLPELGLSQTYRINVTSYNMDITKVSLIPVVKGKECDITSEKELQRIS